ncbi:ATP-binding protein [uncultured Rhodospira sp.]|uniref:ATP-binding protein n=1 Tax=uncultured Rhodospira sp. TaxID=1936189 RepID=UPI0026125D54|nr:ATP-binding protein [uncultured Rhodospira sp.]
MTGPPYPDSDGPEILTALEVRQGGDGLLQRVLAPATRGLLTVEAAEQAPALMTCARDATRHGGLVLLLTAANGWRLDVANLVVTAAERLWPALYSRRDTLRLALHEAWVNALMHGCLRVPPNLRDTPEGWIEHSRTIDAALADPARGDRPVLLTLTAETDGWVARVMDQGPGFDAPADVILGPAVPAQAKTATRGRGLTLILGACDRVSWHDGGREIRMMFAYPPREEF